MKDTGTLRAIKLVHRFGQVGCANFAISKWGCGKAGISIAITDVNDDIIFPKDISAIGWFTLSSYDSNSNEIILSNPLKYIQVKKGMILRLWYGEDLKESNEHDNVGISCADVYAKVSGIL